MPKLIYLVGPEGAGKSSNARLIRYYLTKYYGRCVAVPKPGGEIRSRNLFVDVLARFLMRVGRVEYDYRPEGKPMRKVDSVLMSRIHGLWIFIELLGFLTAYFVKVIAVQLFGCDVVLTRFIIDFLTDMFLLSRRAGKSFRLVSTLTYVFLRPMFGVDLIIYLDADYSVLRKRYHIAKRDMIEPPWRIARIRAISRALFNIISKYYDDLMYIDTTDKRLSQVFNIVFSRVKGLYEDHG
ncbi:MAG: hypothetical protein ACP5NQ_00705 [Vulcanisaeta sp.]